MSFRLAVLVARWAPSGVVITFVLLVRDLDERSIRACVPAWKYVVAGTPYNSQVRKEVSVA